MDYRNIPKVELHIHLDGSVRPKTIAELANISLEEAISLSVAPAKCHDLNDYLTRFALSISIMNSKENLERIAYELAQDLKNDNVIYAEIRFAPMQHVSADLSDDDIITSILKGLHKVNIKTNLILCMLRNHIDVVNYQVIDLAKKYLGKGVCAIDLAGDEAIYPTKKFAKLFEYAKIQHVPFTIHAGEAAGVDSINAAINFGAYRIGHGINCILDEKTMNLIKDKNISLEICPTSNIQTNSVTNINKHPIYEFYKKGIKISINTDNRTVSNVTLTSEYELLSKTFGFTVQDFYQINSDALKASFASSETKALLLGRLENR